jgi:transcriptional regulator with XRE-family HTH domain
MKEFFENLKEIRESKGIRLEDISRKSRLPMRFLEDIEAGRLENLPVGYDRIFFKRYLDEIGENKEEVWQDFNLFFGTGPLERDVPYSSDIPGSEKLYDEEENNEEENGEEKEAPKKSSFFQELSLRWNLDKLHKYFWVVVTILVLGVVGYFAYKQFMFVKNSPLEVKEVTVSDFIEEMQRQDSLLTPQLSENTEVKPAVGNGIDVRMKSLERTWIREIRDSKDTVDYILPKGIEREIKAKESVQLMLGRADGVRLWLNGDSLGVMGKADQVVLKLLLNNEGIADKRLKKATKRAIEEKPDSTSRTN